MYSLQINMLIDQALIQSPLPPLSQIEKNSTGNRLSKGPLHNLFYMPLKPLNYLLTSQKCLHILDACSLVEIALDTQVIPYPKRRPWNCKVASWWWWSSGLSQVALQYGSLQYCLFSLAYGKSSFFWEEKTKGCVSRNQTCPIKKIASPKNFCILYPFPLLQICAYGWKGKAKIIMKRRELL